MSIELIEAIRRGDVDEVRRNLRDGADPNFRLTLDAEYGLFAEHRTALMFAAGEPSSTAEIVQILLDAGADPLLTSAAGATAGWYACTGGWGPIQADDDVQRLRVLLDAGCSPHEVPCKRNSCVIAAAERGAVNQLRLLIQCGASLSPIDGYVPLFEAATSGNLECVKAIVEAGFPPDFVDSEHNALSSVGSSEVAEYLWDLGVRLIPREQGFDAIDMAIDEDNIPVLRFFLSKAEPEVIQEKLHKACGSFMKPAAVRLFIEMGADPRIPKKGLSTPLHWACWQGDGNMGGAIENVEETVQALIDAGADPNFSDRGVCPLHQAASGDWASPTSARVLLRNGAFVDPVDGSGQTPLILAASSGCAELVRILLEYGADPTRRDRQGRTALDRAQESLNYTLPPGIVSWSDAATHGKSWESFDADRQFWVDRLAEEQEIVRLLTYSIENGS